MTVMLVVGNADRATLAAWMGKWGHEVRVAEDVEEAWAILDGTHVPWVVVVDQESMGAAPIEPGQCPRPLGGQGPCYCIVLCEPGRTADVLPLLHVGADACLERPVGPEVLKAYLAAGERALRKRAAERKAGEGEARRVLRLFERAQEIAELGCWEIDPTRRTVWASPQARRLYGFEGAEWSLGAVQEMPLPEYRPLLDRALRDLVTSGTPYDVEFKIRRAHDGALMDIHSVAEKDADDATIFGIIQDVTDKKAAEQALRESERKYRTLVENLSDVVWSLSPDLVVTYVSSTDEAQRGYRADEIIGRSVFDLLLPESAEQVRKASEQYQEAARAGRALESASLVLGQVRKGGSTIWTEVVATPLQDESGAIVGYQGVSRDVTRRTLAERELAESRQRLDVTLRSIADGVITTDTGGRIVMLNPAAQRWTGWTAAEACGRPVGEVFVIRDEATRGACADPVEQVLTTGEVIECPGPTVLVARGGRQMVVTGSAAPLRDERERTIGIVLVFRDVTEQRKMEETIQRTQRLDALGVLAGGIAHDFNNLLSGVFGYLELARMRAQSLQDAGLRDFLDRAFQAFEKARSLTQQLLTFAKGGTPVRKVAHLEPMLRDSVRFALSGSAVVARFDVAEGLMACEFDENQLSRVVGNLVINAQHAMPEGGEIVIRACNVLLDEGQVPALPAGLYVRFSVADSGCGIPRENLPRIFDPFFTTRAGGSGLGLATSHSIVSKHGGAIEVESEPGRGTTFVVYLPASRQSIAPPPRGEERGGTGTGCVLVMDDEALIVDLLGEMLASLGYQAVIARSGQEAMDLMARHDAEGNRFVAALLDLTMAGGPSGRDVAAEIGRMGMRVPLIASSGYSADPVMAFPESYGFAASLAKPYRLVDLAEVLRRCVLREAVPELSL